MYQRIFLAGNLGRDPELRYTPNGTPVTQFSVATNEKWTGQDGQQRMDSDPETGGPKLWTRKDGRTGASYEIIARKVQFVGKRGAASFDEPRDADIPPEAYFGEDAT